MDEKLYVVGAVSGVKNWEDKFLKIEAQLHNKGFTNVRTPMEYPKGLTQKEYMVLSCESVFWADKIIVTSGYESSKGTKAEIALAESYGLPVVYLHYERPIYKGVQDGCLRNKEKKGEK